MKISIEDIMKIIESNVELYYFEYEAIKKDLEEYEENA